MSTLDPIVTMPMQGMELNEMISAWMSVTRDVRTAELNHLIASSQNLTDSYLEIGLKGAIIRETT